MAESEYNCIDTYGGAVMDTFGQLKKKEVINICSGLRLGYITDLEFDRCTGRICAFTVSGEPCYFGVFGKGGKLTVPWGCIVKISDDIVLVSIENNDRGLKDGRC